MLTGHGRARPPSSLSTMRNPDARARRRGRLGRRPTATRASGGGVVDEQAGAARRCCSASPSTSMSTPARSLRTKPARPSATAWRYTNGRNPTPWTVPVTRRRAVVRDRPRRRHQQIRGSGSPTSMSTMRVPPNEVSRTTMPSRLGRDLADPVARAPSGWARRAASAASASSGGDDGDHLALVGDVERIDAEQVAGPVDGRVDRQQRLVEHDGQVGSPGPARCTPCRPRRGSGRAASGSPGAASSRASTSSPTGAVSERMSASRARSPRASITAMPWSAMVPDTSTTSPGCTCSGPSVRPAGTTPTPAGRDVEAVGRAPADHLGVAGDDGDAGRRGGLGHVGDDGSQLGDREALLDDERGRQPRRPGAHARRGR